MFNVHIRTVLNAVTLMLNQQNIYITILTLKELETFSPSLREIGLNTPEQLSMRKFSHLDKNISGPLDYPKVKKG